MFLGDKNLSKLFYVIRGLAIISVVYAHSTSVSNHTLQRIGETIGVLGVPLFLFCSGYYFKPCNWKKLSHKLSTSIISPWIVWGTFCFVLYYLLGGTTLEIPSYISFILGHYTWLYYIPIYLIIRVLFNAFNSTKFTIFAIFISFLYILTTFYYPVESDSINNWITPYQNPLSWIGYFGIGILAKRYHLLEKLFHQNIWIKILVIICFFSLFCGLVLNGSKISYWNPMASVINIVALTAIPLIASFIVKAKIFIILGTNSLLIYILHMQLGIGGANTLLRLIHIPDIFYFFLKPFLVLAITLLLILFMKRILDLFKLDDLKKYLGIAG